MPKTYASYEELLKALEAGDPVSRDDAVQIDGFPVPLMPKIRPHCLPGTWRNPEGWVPKKPWLAFHTVQWGKRSASSSFFEVFSKVPDTYVHTEGESLDEAEQKAWEKIVRAARCPEHEFERRGYTNGVGFCKHCGMFKSKAFEPSEHCVICGKACYYSVDIDGNWYCEDHVDQIPDEKASESLKWVRHHGEDDFKELTEENFRKGIEGLAEVVSKLKEKRKKDAE
jgi:hypothetical protein